MDRGKAIKNILESLNDVRESVTGSQVRGLLYSIADKECMKEPDGSYQCHECTFLVLSNLKKYSHAGSWTKNLKYGKWDERKWKLVGELLSKNKKTFQNKHINNLITDIIDGSVNGHSFIKYGRTFIDPYLYSLGVSDAETDKFGQYFEKIFKLAGIKFIDYSKYEAIRENFEGEKVTKQDLDAIERYADRLFGAVGIDVAFTRHFLDRVNDARNKRQITKDELTRLFRESYKKYGKKIASLGPEAQAVLNDMKTDINMPFVLIWDERNRELDLVAKTVMRKKNFMTSNPKLTFENKNKWGGLR